MAEDLGDKTEAPTPQRRTKAREQGNIPRSQDLNAAVLLLGFMVLLDFFGKDLVRVMGEIMQSLLGPQSLSHLTSTGIQSLLLNITLLVGRAMLPLLAGVVLLAVVINLIQVGFFASAQRLQPNLNALNPVKGLGRIFGKKEALTKTALSAAKLVLVAWVAYRAVLDRMDTIVTIQQYDFLQIFGIGADVVYWLAIRLGIVLVILAIIDYVWQRRKHERELKMTKQEVKDDMKRMEGDPQIKARRRDIARQIALRRAKQDVPTADVVVTNPTHFAVALKYDADRMRAPRVVAKGADFLAMRIREIAAIHGIPILERPPLARGLYKLVDVGQEIPEQFYTAIAEILAYVYELTGKHQKVAS
ncbi:MAG: flagellar biosynthesis protein FlhB [Phycisphaerales bacterium]|nr:flagellar biosynthesis protein FlhB [Phycisphaerales bacterium]